MVPGAGREIDRPVCHHYPRQDIKANRRQILAAVGFLFMVTAQQGCLRRDQQDVR
jgi:hypothetical protein